MTFLLDVNPLIAAIWEDHADHATVNQWLAGKKMATCPISELGFLRISSGETFVFRAEIGRCRKWLGDFIQKHDCEFIPDDFSPQKTQRQNQQAVDRHLSCGIGSTTPNEIGDVRQADFTSCRGNHKLICAGHPAHEVAEWFYFYG